MSTTFISLSSGDYRLDDPKIRTDSLTDAKVGSVKGEVSVAMLDGGVAYMGELPPIHSMTSTLNEAAISQVITRGISFLVPITVPAYNVLYDSVHFDVVISGYADVVESGEPDYEKVTGRYKSYDGGYFYLELSSLYDLPSEGADISSGSAQIGRTVKLFASNVDLNMNEDVFAFWRPAYYKLGVFVENGDWNGTEIRFPKSIPTNTGIDPMGNQIITLDHGRMQWAPGNNADFEIYIGYQSNVSDYSSRSELLHRDSSVVRSGFKYFDGSEILDVPAAGVPYASVNQPKFLVTNGLKSDRPVIAIYRAKTTAGNTSWVAELVFPSDFFETGGQTFHPPVTIRIPSGTYSEYYHAQVIMGTDPDLANYFTGGDTSAELPDLGYAELEDFGYSKLSEDASRFWYFNNGIMTNPSPIHAIPNSKDVSLTYHAENSYAGDRRLYVFWRFLYSSGFSSSSFSSSSSSDSSSNSSSSSSSGSNSDSNSSSSQSQSSSSSS